MPSVASVGKSGSGLSPVAYYCRYRRIVISSNDAKDLLNRLSVRLSIPNNENKSVESQSVHVPIVDSVLDVCLCRYCILLLRTFEASIMNN
jgi:hypothetical protein